MLHAGARVIKKGRAHAFDWAKLEFFAITTKQIRKKQKEKQKS